MPTPTESQEELLEAIVAAIEPLADEHVDAIGFGIPSVIDRATGMALGSTNIPLRDVSLTDLTQERFGVPAVVENDANVAALAEWKLGAGRGANDLVMLTLGTGVGGGLVLGGSLYRGIAELGHVVVVADGPPCQGNCNGRGHLESVASGNAADRAAEKLWGEGATAELLVGRGAGGRSGRARGALRDRASARRRDRLVREHVRARARHHRRRLRASPRSSSSSPRRSRSRAARRSSRTCCRCGSSRAELGLDAGLIGAGLIAFEALGAE